MKFEDLTFERLKQRNLYRIPVYLFEQVKGRSWTVERLYNLAPLIFANDANCIWVLKDRQEIKGVLWIAIDVLSEKVNVIVFSIDPEYQDDSLEGARDFLRQFIKDYNKVGGHIELKEKINWVTSESEKLEKIGGRIPGTIMVEV